MPSPFPGMDPFLEHPSLFPGLHGRLIAYIGEALQSVLPSPYYAEIYERVVVEESGRRIEPDVNVLRRGKSDEEDGSETDLFAPTATMPVMVAIPDEAYTETYLEVLTVGDGSEKIVTVVEVLSPSNKRPGSQGRDQYLRKQDEVLHSRAHLVEIDLLRQGLHTTAVPWTTAVDQVGRFDYHACVSRSHRRGRFDVYPIRLSDRLPVLSLPLLTGDRDIPLDLQSVFDRCYETGPYARRVLYRERSPEPPLSPEDAAWVDERLKTAGK